MKAAKNIIYKVLSVALLAAVWMLASCDSGFVQKTAESGNTNVTVTVSAGNARTVSPEGSILDYKDWDITFKPTGITTGADEIKSKLNWDELGEISGSFLVPPGTYTVSVHSTPSGWTGQTDNVVVTASGSVPVKVFVRREHTGTGDFSYTLTCLDDAPPDVLTAELQPVDGGTSVGLELTPPEASSDYIFRATDVPAGYYQLSVVYTNPNTNEQTELVKYKLDSLIEIIGGLETTGTGEFSILPEPPRIYYAVMEESAADYIGSGIFDRYPAMFDTLMRYNTDVLKEINVLDAVPVFRKEYIDHLAGGKTVDVYRYIDGGYYLVTENGVTISCDAFIADGAAGDEIPVSWQEVGPPGDFSLKVNGGVAVFVTDVAFPTGTVTVTVDNPERYTGTPFLKFSQPDAAPPVTQFTTPPGSGYYVVSGNEPGTYVLADATTSPAVLWTKGTDSKNIYVVPQSDISETMVLPEAISISDSSKRGFCFDDRLNLYVASDSGVTRYDQSNGTYSENNFLTILSDQTVTGGGVAFDTATNILWVLTYSDSTYTLKGYDNPAGYAVDATTSVAYDYSGTYSGSGAEISSFTVHNGTVYLAMPELTEQVSLIHNIYTAACPVSNELAEINLSKGIGDLAAAAGISGISDNAVISDMSVVDGALYVLFREVSYNEKSSSNFSNSDHNYSRGGVIKLNITGNVSVDTTFGTGGILGWTTESAGTVVSDDSSATYNCYWPAPGSTDRFYGPSRFIAVAPKKLVIADDGGYYEDGGVIQKNRVVTVDLSGSQPGMTVKEPNTVVEFDDTLSASGFGSFTPTGN